MKKKQPETNPDPQLRREALASDVEAFLKSGKTIEQIPSGVSAQANLRPANHRPAQPAAKPAATDEGTAEAPKDGAVPATTDSTATDSDPKPAS